MRDASSAQEGPVAKVTMPQLGESVAEGTIGRWLKKPGDRVEKYEPIVEVITDKVNAEVPSPFAGTLTAILVEEGATVPNETPDRRDRDRPRPPARRRAGRTPTGRGEPPPPARRRPAARARGRRAAAAPGHAARRPPRPRRLAPSPLPGRRRRRTPA